MNDATTKHGAAYRDEPRTWRLLFLSREKTRILVDANGDLPSVALHPFARLGYHLTSQARECFGIEVLCLTILDEQQSIAWMEWIAGTAPEGWSWIPRAEIPGLAPALREYDAHLAGEREGAFARPGWLNDFYSWAKDFLPREVQFTGRFQQWNPGPTFSLIRFETSARRAVWLKAVGHPNTREFSVTPVLSARHPEDFPKVLATRADWKALLLEEVDGDTLHTSTSLEAWTATARRLAQIQIDWLDDTQSLFAAGAEDWRFAHLARWIDPFFEQMEEVFAHQPNSPPERLTGCELRQLAAELRNLMRRIEDLEIPDSLVHGDFSPHNVILREGRPIFIDWANAYVSNPFLTFEYFRHRMVKDHPEHWMWVSAMRTAYAAEWSRSLPAEAVNAALAATPAVAALFCALTISLENGCLELDKKRWAIRRSLVRTMQREIAAIEVMA